MLVTEIMQEVEVRGETWTPKIAGTYETELFTDSGWKAAKNLEITQQVPFSEHSDFVIQFELYFITVALRKIEDVYLLYLVCY